MSGTPTAGAVIRVNPDRRIWRSDRSWVHLSAALLSVAALGVLAVKRDWFVWIVKHIKSVSRIRVKPRGG
jgi:hypothetical protein